MHLGAPFGELCRDDIGGALLLEPDLGMRVDVAADRGQLVETVPYLGDDRHGGSSTGCPHHTDSAPSRPSDCRSETYPQPSSRSAQPEFQILVMWRILSPSNCMTYT